MSEKAIKGPLPEITLKNMNNITITDVVESAGRKFQMGEIAGSKDKKVIFHHFFKQAQALLHDAKTRDELHSMKAFIGKLKDAETKAQENYKGRNDNWYKFKSFWHRLFGGAFWGTHLDRLGDLSKKCDKKESQLLDKLNKCAGKIDVKDLAECYSDKPETIEVGDRTYKIQYTDDDETKKLDIEDSEGKQLTISYNNLGFTIVGEMGGDEIRVLEKVADDVIRNRKNKDSLQEEWDKLPRFDLTGFCRDPIAIGFKERELNVWLVDAWLATDDETRLYIQDKNNKNEHLEFIPSQGRDAGVCSKLSGKWLGDVEGLAQEIWLIGKDMADRVRIFGFELQGRLDEFKMARDRLLDQPPRTFKWQEREYIIWEERSPSKEVSIHIQEKAFEGTKEKQIVLHTGYETEVPFLKKIDGDIDETTKELFKCGLFSYA